MYKIIRDPIDGSENIINRNSDGRQFSNDSANADYQQFVKDVVGIGTTCVEGATSVGVVTYTQARMSEYPSLEEQLDLLWHAIDKGKLNKTSDFYKKLKAVKKNNPKPE